MVSWLGMGAFSVSGTDLEPEIQELIDDYRDQCLWFWRQDYVPETTDEVLDALDLIERYGDRLTFHAGTIGGSWPMVKG